MKEYPEDVLNFVGEVANPVICEALDKIGYLPPSDNVRMAMNVYLAGCKNTNWMSMITPHEDGYLDPKKSKLSLSLSKAVALHTKRSAQLCKIMNIIKNTFHRPYKI